MEIFFSLLVLSLLAGVTAMVVSTIRHDGRDHLPPVSSGRPWHGNVLWDVSDPRDLSQEQPYRPRR
ncbi:hypothetical protein [Arthrobacter citreus]|uniref:hypothetical protein n=1 Tax=Arthrobacter citreus TaxID=1670 RepID=UPI0037FA1A63